MTYNRVVMLGELGRLEEAWALARETLAASELSGSARLSTLRVSGAICAWEIGRWDDALAEFDAVGDMEPESEAELHAHRIFIASHRADWTEAARELNALNELIAGDAADWAPWAPRVSIMASQALVSEGAGEPRRALAQVAGLAAGGKEHEPFRYEALPALVRLALAAGEDPLARTAAQTARRDADRMPRHRQRAHALWCEGLVRGDPGLIEQAAAMLRGLGVPLAEGTALEDAAVLLARVRPFGVRPGTGSRGPRARPGSGWASLTAMENRVAELAAAGRSNPEIAATLFISRRTVESHVSRILAKLQVTSRWEIAVPVTGKPL